MHEIVNSVNFIVSFNFKFFYNSYYKFQLVALADCALWPPFHLFRDSELHTSGDNHSAMSQNDYQFYFPQFLWERNLETVTIPLPHLGL